MAGWLEDGKTGRIDRLMEGRNNGMTIGTVME